MDGIGCIDGNGCEEGHTTAAVEGHSTGLGDGHTTGSTVGQSIEGKGAIEGHTTEGKGSVDGNTMAGNLEGVINHAEREGLGLGISNPVFGVGAAREGDDETCECDGDIDGDDEKLGLLLILGVRDEEDEKELDGVG